MSISDRRGGEHIRRPSREQEEALTDDDFMGDDATSEERDVPAPSFTRMKRNLIVEAAELTSGNTESTPVICETYVFDPEGSEEPLGSLYLTVETINTSPKGRDVLTSVATAIRKEYYRDTDRDMLTALESALDQVNHVLADLAAEGEPEWVDNFHAAVCVFRGQTLHISRSGKGELLLSRNQRLTDIGEGLSDPAKRRPLHTFTSVASGAVSEHDMLILATPQLLHLLPRDRLHQFLIGKDPSQAIGSLRALLEDSREATAFALLILRFVKMPERLPAPEVPRTLPPHAIPTPHQRDRRPSLRPPQPIFTRRSLPKSIGRFIVRGSGLLWQQTTRRLLPALHTGAQWSAETGSRLARRASRGVHHAASQWQSRRHGTERPPTLSLGRSFGDERTVVSNSFPIGFVGSIRDWLISLPGMLKRMLSNLPHSARLFLLLTVALGVLLAGSLFALSKKREEDAAVRSALEKLQEARTKREGADAAFIYENTDQARQLIRESRTAAEEVGKTPYYDTEVQQLLSGLQETQDRIERVTRINDPKVVGDFASIAPSLQTPAMAVIGNSVFTFNPENNAIYRLNAENGETKVVSQSSQGIGYFRAAHPLPAEKTILFSTDSPGLALFDTDRGDLLKQEITLPEGVSNIRALGTFGSRLYILAPEKKMIYGYSKTLAGYEGGSEWLKEKNVPIDRAVAMGIDGYIYLLTDSGEMRKLLRGTPVDFKQSSLATPMNHPTRLVTNEELKHLYVLDPSQKRVLVYDTTGTLTKQLVFPNAGELRDIAVKGKEEALFVLDETKVYTVGLK